VRRAATILGVETVVGLSTDKAVKPVNVMGMSKAIGEKILLNPRNARYRTRFLCVRYGNVLGSRGSVVPLFVDRIRRKRPLPVTDPEMTRFLLTLPQAIGLVFQATMTGDAGTLHVRKMPATTIGDLADVLSEALTGDPGYPREPVGVRPGEKIHETLVSEEEMKRAIEGEASYVVYPAGQLLKPVLQGEIQEYTSDGTTRLSHDELRSLLHAEGWV
jgi:UDP-glucose 4-epimerase